ncbi:hypothetical protein C471_02210 [Halorubrum saccharovorum DSM 1137]|uniref:Uncharacterized protein n=1 Tax=Halorubrum saccharovorum DSM 1137 TaxID=1227484 RepID=M0E6T6_9EURY|nr:hypothetical protein [Halorubrum saccharovorum]ELZ42768.1 hypothetical protein C471_02210 [Halorubrum saccharovorum DSM 1137]
MPREGSDSLTEYASRNTEFISRVLAHGDEEARAYALALLANSGSVEAIDEVQAQLDEIRREIR